MWEYLDHSGNCISSPELAVEFLEACSLDTDASALSRSSPTEEKSCCSGSATESCLASPSGTTCGPSMENRGEEKSMSSPGDSHARGFPSQETAKDWTTREADYGASSCGSFAKWDRDLLLWRTHQCLL